VLDEGFSVEHPEDRIGVPDVNCQQHRRTQFLCCQ
jgi:hypothetical protein